MGDNLSFYFNILVVEDERGWEQDLDHALQESVKDSKRFYWQLVENRRAAWDYLSEKRYHFISIDQNIPDTEGEIVNPENGLGLCEQIVEQNLLIYRIIYTVYGEIAYGHRVGKLDATPYLEKRSDPYKVGVYSPSDWAQFIKYTLEKDYIPFALERAGRYLPLSLAERARRALSNHKKKAYDPYIRLWIEIWESALHLAFVQTLSLCSKAGISLGRITNGTLVEQEQILRDAWPRLSRTSWMSPWLRYIGVGNKTSGAGAGGRFLQGASEPLRKLRNDLAHSFSTDAWDTLTDHDTDPLLFLIDALAFWIENPLMTRLQFHPTARHRVTGQAIMGDLLPFPVREIDMPDLENIPATSADHICLIWRREGIKPQLLDLDPFMVLDRDQQGRPHLWLLSHPARQRGVWLYRSLTDGRLQPRTLSAATQQTVEAVFR